MKFVDKHGQVLWAPFDQSTDDEISCTFRQPDLSRCKLARKLNDPLGLETQPAHLNALHSVLNASSCTPVTARHV